MRTPLAWRNTMHNKVRTFAALCGVAFAILLVFMQLGFYDSCSTSATMVYDLLEFDVVISSPQYVHLRKPGTIPRVRLRQASAVPGVSRVYPLFAFDAEWRNPTTFFLRELFVLGVQPSDRIFKNRRINDLLPEIVRPGTALMDEIAQPLFGPHSPGTVAEVNGRQVEIVGSYRQGTGFIAGAAIIVSEGTFHRIMGGYPVNRPHLGLVKLEPGADADAVVAKLRERLPSDVVVRTRAELSKSEKHYFIDVKPVGFMFKSGVLIGFLVGAVILYQILASEITNHLREFATLKAIGYGPGYLNGLVMKQGVYFALLGFLPALILSVGLYWIVRVAAKLPMYLTADRVVFVLVFSIVMCAVSGMLAIRKLSAADPADLF